MVVFQYYEVKPRAFPGCGLCATRGKEVTLTSDMLHHNVDYTPYEGMELTGWPETTISRGVVVCDGGELKAEIGRGEFLRCATPEPATLTSTA